MYAWVFHPCIARPGVMFIGHRVVHQGEVSMSHDAMLSVGWFLAGVVVGIEIALFVRACFSNEDGEPK